MRIESVCSDLATVSGFDAVVCPTDSQLVAFGGATRDLVQRAGARAVTAARARGPVAPGGAAHAPGGAVARWVIHAAVFGLRAEDLAAPRRKGTLTSAAVLYAAARSAFALAERLGCRSVALPDLGAPARFPANDAAVVVVDALWAHLRERAVSALDRVAFVLATEPDRGHYQLALDARARRAPLPADDGVSDDAPTLREGDPKPAPPSFATACDEATTTLRPAHAALVPSFATDCDEATTLRPSLVPSFAAPPDEATTLRPSPTPSFATECDEATTTLRPAHLRT